MSCPLLSRLSRPGRLLRSSSWSTAVLYSALLMNSRLPNSFGRSNGTTVVLLQVPSRSGAPHGALGVDSAAAPLGRDWVVAVFSANRTARAIADVIAARKIKEHALILI